MLKTITDTDSCHDIFFEVLDTLRKLIEKFTEFETHSLFGKQRICVVHVLLACLEFFECPGKFFSEFLADQGDKFYTDEFLLVDGTVANEFLGGLIVAYIGFFVDGAVFLAAICDRSLHGLSDLL